MGGSRQGNEEGGGQSGADAGDAAAQPPSRLEWIVAALGLLLVASALGLLLYEAVTGDGGPPDLSVTVRDTLTMDDHYLVRVALRNEGDATAAEVQVEGELLRDGEATETSAITIDFVPAQSQRQAGLIFRLDPAAHELRLRVLGYSEP